MQKPFVVLMISMLLLAASNTDAAKYTRLLAASDVIRNADPDTTLGSYYTLQFPIPAEIQGQEVYAAAIEFYAEVSSRGANGYASESVVLEIYALKAAFTGELTPGSFKTPSAMVRNIPVGQSQRIRIDITEAVRALLTTPSTNFGLAIGSLTGVRDGRFTLNANILASGAVARLTIVYGEPGS